MGTQATRKLLTDAVHTHRATSSRGLLERAFTAMFGGLVYNQIWEDPRADFEGLDLTADSRVLTISSAGCNVLNYLTRVPGSITAVDLNANHIYLTRLKLAALELLPTWEDFFRFFGRADSKLNVKLYRRLIRDGLDRATRRYWDGGRLSFTRMRHGRISFFARNFYRYGVLGYFVRMIHLLARLHGVRAEPLLASRTLDEQRRIYDERIDPLFDSALVKSIGRMPVFLFGIGIPPAQRDRIIRESGGDIITLFRTRLRRLACDFPIQDNYFAWQAFGRRYDRERGRAVPDYLLQANYATLKDNAHRVSTHIGSITDYLRGQPVDALDRFVFLDAMDWMSREALSELWHEIARVGEVGSRIVFRSAASVSPVEDALPSGLRERFHYDTSLSRAIYALDRSAIYGGMHVYVLRDPVREARRAS